MTACGEDNGTGPDTLRFGLSGQITVELETPLRLGAGLLRQRLEWESSGAWSIREQLSYKNLLGDETLTRSQGNPFAFVASYVQLITTVNSVASLQLFVPELPIGITADCGPTRTRITFSIVDVPRDSTATWIQCADGSLTSIRTLNAGPEPAAARLVMATQAARDATFGPDRLSAYHGSVPFATIDRSDYGGGAIVAPFTIRDDVAWNAFWLQHAASEDAPAVDFDTEMVVVGAVGRRGEAGDSVEVRRILQVDNGTLVHLVERIPGDFCSPVARTHYPVHIVVSPVTPAPVRFADVGLELVPCGR